MECLKCSTKNQENRKFCSECGAKLTKLCHKCGFENLPGDKFCGECGSVLSTPAASPPKELSADEKLAKIKRYLPNVDKPHS